jgi:hypothetical protein
LEGTGVHFDSLTGWVSKSRYAISFSSEIKASSLFGRFFKIKLPPPSHGGFGFIGRISFVLKIQHNVIKVADVAKMKTSL